MDRRDARVRTRAERADTGVARDRIPAARGEQSDAVSRREGARVRSALRSSRSGDEAVPRCACAARMIAAGSIRSPAELLTAIADSEQELEVLAHLAGNPSAPPSVHERFASDEFLDARRREARHLYAESLRQQRISDEQIEMHLERSAPLIEAMASRMVAKIREGVARRPRQKPAARSAPVAAAPSPRSAAARAAPPRLVRQLPPERRKDLPPEEYERLAREQPQLRSALATNDAVPAAVLDLIQREGSLDMKRLVAMNPSAGPILGSIDHEADLAIDTAVARNEGAPPEVRASAAARLSTRTEDHARAAAAACSDAPEEVLDRLARDPREVVRLALQRHPRGRKSLLAVYAESPIPF